jgi:hypothetical protein
MDGVRKVFTEFDSDGDGGIDQSEMKALLLALGATITSDDEVTTAFDKIDGDGDGMIDADEFIKWFATTMAPPPPDTATAADAAAEETSTPAAAAAAAAAVAAAVAPAAEAAAAWSASEQAVVDSSAQRLAGNAGTDADDIDRPAAADDDDDIHGSEAGDVAVPPGLDEEDDFGEESFSSDALIRSLEDELQLCSKNDLVLVQREKAAWSGVEQIGTLMSHGPTIMTSKILSDVRTRLSSEGGASAETLAPLFQDLQRALQAQEDSAVELHGFSETENRRRGRALENIVSGEHGQGAPMIDEDNTVRALRGLRGFFVRLVGLAGYIQNRRVGVR